MCKKAACASEIYASDRPGSAPRCLQISQYQCTLYVGRGCTEDGRECTEMTVSALG